MDDFDLKTKKLFIAILISAVVISGAVIFYQYGFAEKVTQEVEGRLEESIVERYKDIDIDK